MKSILLKSALIFVIAIISKKSFGRDHTPVLKENECIVKESIQAHSCQKWVTEWDRGYLFVSVSTYREVANCKMNFKVLQKGEQREENLTFDLYGPVYSATVVSAVPVMSVIADLATQVFAENTVSDSDISQAASQRLDWIEAYICR